MSNTAFKFGVIGSGSWATALVKILTDNKQPVNWLVRSLQTISYIQSRRHNPNYLPSAYFDTSLLQMKNDINEVIEASDVLIMAVPSAFIKEVLAPVKKDGLANKKILSAIKGIVPGPDVLLNEYLSSNYNVSIEICRRKGHAEIPTG